MKNLKSKLSFIFCAILIVSVLLSATGCISTTPENPLTEENTSEAEAVSAEIVSQIGQGAKSFYLSVFYEDGTSNNVIVNTDQKTVGEALIDLGIIDGENGPYGLYIKKINGVTADYETTGTYWAFYIDGDYAATGADMTEIKNGTLYSFRIEK